MGRPVFLDLRRIRLPLPALVSIMHRASGVLLFLALPFLLALWQWSLTDEGFASIASLVSSPLGGLLLFALAWAFAHHLFAGLRHLGLDMGLGLELAAARRNAVLVLGAGLLCALGLWWTLA